MDKLNKKTILALVLFSFFGAFLLFAIFFFLFLKKNKPSNASDNLFDRHYPPYNYGMDTREVFLRQYLLTSSTIEEPYKLNPIEPKQLIITHPSANFSLVQDTSFCN